MDIISFLSILIPFVLPILIIFYISIRLKIPNTGADSLANLPGSRGLPLVGEMLDFYRKNKAGVPERFVFDRINKYSSKIFKSSFMGNHMVFFCGAEGNKFLFSSEKKYVKHWWPDTTGPIFALPTTKVNDSSLLLRNCVAPYFKPDTLQTFVPIMDSTAKQFLRKHWEGRDLVVVYPSSRHFTFTITCRTLLGIEDEETVARFAKLFDHITKALFSVHWNIPGTNYYRAVNSAATLKKEIKDLTTKWKNDHNQGRIKSNPLTDVFNEVFKDEEFFPCAVIGLVSASFDTTSSTLSAIVMYLAQFPDIYNKVLAEHREIAKSKQPGELLDWGDIQKMKYSWNVACEVMRLHPPVPGSFRVAITDFSFGGYEIRKGTKLHWNSYSTHKNPEYFKDPDKFNPSRFEENEEVPYTFVPFGGGQRMCVGMPFAKIKLLVLMHNLVTKFRWEKVNIDEKMIFSPILKPAKGLPVYLYSH